jgi:hypothetical protein
MSRLLNSYEWSTVVCIDGCGMSHYLLTELPAMKQPINDEDSDWQ